MNCLINFHAVGEYPREYAGYSPPPLFASPLPPNNIAKFFFFFFSFFPRNARHFLSRAAAGTSIHLTDGSVASAAATRDSPEYTLSL